LQLIANGNYSSRRREAAACSRTLSELDENLSDRIVAQIVDLFPDSTHVKSEALTHTDDSLIADSAKQRCFTIVSKDSGFYQTSVAFGTPPKFIWLRVGNCSTAMIVGFLRSHQELISEFISSETESVLVLERKRN
jgi:predicted nuclease of predicted toxin-antitoxin system